MPRVIREKRGRRRNKTAAWRNVLLLAFFQEQRSCGATAARNKPYAHSRCKAGSARAFRRVVNVKRYSARRREARARAKRGAWWWRCACVVRQRWRRKLWMARVCVQLVVSCAARCCSGQRSRFAASSAPNASARLTVRRLMVIFSAAMSRCCRYAVQARVLRAWQFALRRRCVATVTQRCIAVCA